MIDQDYRGLFERFSPAAETDVLLNGLPLSAYGLEAANGWPEIGEVTPQTEYVQIPGAAGSLDVSLVNSQAAAFPGRRTIKLDVVISGDQMESWEAKTAIGRLVGQYVTISRPVWPGYFRGRLSLSAWEDGHVGPYFAQATATLSIECDTPYMYGEEVQENLVVGNENKLKILGNQPVLPEVSVILTEKQSFTITKPGTTGKVTIVPGSGGITGATTYLNFETRNVNPTPRWQVALESEFFEIGPGEVTLGATLAGVLTYTPLYLI